MENGDAENAYRTYRQRMDKLPEVEGATVMSVSTGLRQVEKEDTWEMLAEQYQIEHYGERPDDHVLCKVLTVMNLVECRD